ncbi:MAG: hypothetical protein ACD_55C00074G0001 [uncultured bacterium]|nr:MAG: hypothetical protein ACD_55C00074G0001 [uncultured bacterium]
MQREHRDLDGEGQCEGQEHPHLGGRVEVQFPEADDAEVAAARLEVKGDQCDQHEERTDRGVDEELDCSVNPVLAAPDTDHEVHRDQHHFPVDVEEEEVERDKGSDHAYFEQQEADHVLLHLLFNRRVGGKDGDRHDEGGEDDEPEADAVDAQMVAHLEGAGCDPGHVLDELEAADVGPRRVVPRDQRQREDERHHRHRHGNGTEHAVAVLVHKEEENRSDQRCEG